MNTPNPTPPIAEPSPLREALDVVDVALATMEEAEALRRERLDRRLDAIESQLEEAMRILRIVYPA